MYYGWDKENKPNTQIYVAGEPLLETNKWIMQPTKTYCAICPGFHERGKPTPESLYARLSSLEKDLQSFQTKFSEVDRKASETYAVMNRRIGKWKFKRQTRNQSVG